MIRIILIEDHNIVRDGIKSLLQGEPDLEVVAEASSVVAAMTLIKSGLVPEVVLSDINMPGKDGLSICMEIAVDFPSVKVIFLSMYDQPEYIYQAFRSGAKGYILKNVSPDELIFAIRHIATRGERYICSEIAMRLLDRQIQSQDITHPIAHELDFSKKELEVLELVADGFTNQEIAERLLTSKRTIEGHRQSMIDKTGVRNSSALIKFAVVNGLIG